jgi:hypothetical protein
MPRRTSRRKLRGKHERGDLQLRIPRDEQEQSADPDPSCHKYPIPDDTPLPFGHRKIMPGQGNGKSRSAADDGTRGAAVGASRAGSPEDGRLLPQRLRRGGGPQQVGQGRLATLLEHLEREPTSPLRTSRPRLMSRCGRSTTTSPASTRRSAPSARTAPGVSARRCWRVRPTSRCGRRLLARCWRITRAPPRRPTGVDGQAQARPGRARHPR